MKTINVYIIKCNLKYSITTLSQWKIKHKKKTEMWCSKRKKLIIISSFVDYRQWEFTSIMFVLYKM